MVKRNLQWMVQNSCGHKHGILPYKRRKIDNTKGNLLGKVLEDDEDVLTW